MTKQFEFCLLALVLGLSYINSAQAQSDLIIPPIRELMQSDKSNPSALTPNADSNTARRVYVSSILRKFEKVNAATWPRNDLGNRLYGTVKVTLTIGGNGSLLDVYTSEVRLADSRDFNRKSEFAEAVTKWVNQLAPFSPPSLDALQGESSITISTPFTYTKGAGF